MDENVIVDLRLGGVLEADLFDNTAKVRLSHLNPTGMGDDLNQPAWNRETHCRSCCQRKSSPY